MTLSIRERVLSAFFDQLSGLSGVASYRNRDTDVPADRLPAVVQRDGGMIRQYEATDLVLITLGIELECFVAALTDAELGPAISDLYARVTQMVLADPTLGGLAVDLVETENMMGDPVIARDGADRPNAAFTLSFSVTFFLKPGDPYSTAP